MKITTSKSTTSGRTRSVATVLAAVLGLAVLSLDAGTAASQTNGNSSFRNRFVQNGGSNTNLFLLNQRKLRRNGGDNGGKVTIKSLRGKGNRDNAPVVTGAPDQAIDFATKGNRDGNNTLVAGKGTRNDKPPVAVSANTKGKRDGGIINVGTGGNGGGNGNPPVTIFSNAPKSTRGQLTAGKGNRNDGGGIIRVGTGTGGGTPLIKSKTQPLQLAEAAPVTRQIAVEPVKVAPAVKPVQLATASAVVPAAAPAAAVVNPTPAPVPVGAVVADAAPQIETPAPQAAAPVVEPQFTVGQTFAGADGKTYVVVRITDTEVVVKPLAAFVETPVPVQVKVRKKKVYAARKTYYQPRYSSAGYGNGCH